LELLAGVTRLFIPATDSHQLGDWIGDFFRLSWSQFLNYVKQANTVGVLIHGHRLANEEIL
jgi:hypothetical protein